jgi:hypothetical protein
VRELQQRSWLLSHGCASFLVSSLSVGCCTEFLLGEHALFILPGHHGYRVRLFRVILGCFFRAARATQGYKGQQGKHTGLHVLLCRTLAVLLHQRGHCFRMVTIMSCNDATCKSCGFCFCLLHNLALRE